MLNCILYDLVIFIFLSSSYQKDFANKKFLIVRYEKNTQVKCKTDKSKGYKYIGI